MIIVKIEQRLSLFFFVKQLENSPVPPVSNEDSLLKDDSASNKSTKGTY